jgi:O-antigen ligase
MAMSVASSIFLILSLALGITLGPQLRPWSWGPAMVALALALITGAPALVRKKMSLTDVSMIALGVVLAGWFAVRAWVSPVPELARADLLLLASTVGAFLCVRATEGQRSAERILIGGLAVLLSASIVVAGMQLMDPTFSPLFSKRIVQQPTGFFAHYNEGANFILGATLLVAGAALFGQFSRWSRVLFALITILGIVAVYYYRSRGGLLGLAVGSVVFAIVAVWTAKRQQRPWFAPAVVALPIVGLAIMGFLFMSWNNAQAARGFESGQQILDNDIRLYLAGIAISCIGLHPWAGGGSRSFGWECYRFWESATQGQGHAKPEFIHNEFLQALTDYGIIGGAILLIWAMLTIVISMIRVSQPEKVPSNALAWQVGGIAGLTGVFVQSNFSFVFHMMPLAVIFGICLGCTSRSSPAKSVQPAILAISRLLLAGAAGLCVLGLLNYGIKGTRLSLFLWPSMFSKQPKDSINERLEALTAAIAIWPQSALYLDRAQALRQSAERAGDRWPQTPEIQTAVDDYAQAQALDPYEPNIVINQANLLSALSRDSEAETAYAKTIAFQGGMETLSRGTLTLPSTST